MAWITLLPLFASGGVASAAPRFELNIEAQATGAALMQLARTAGVQVVMLVPSERNIQSPMLKGEFTLVGALEHLLRNSGLSYQITADNVVLVQLETAASEHDLAP